MNRKKKRVFLTDHIWSTENAYWGRGHPHGEIMMEFFKQPNRVEKETVPQENNALVPLHLDATPQVLSANEIWKELETVLARLRFFENNCVWWNTDLNLTIKHMEEVVHLGRKVTQHPIERSYRGYEVNPKRNIINLAKAPRREAWGSYSFII